MNSNLRRHLASSAAMTALVTALAMSATTDADAQSYSAVHYTTYTEYDALRRPRLVIGPDPDGSGPLKRRAERTTYDPVGRVISRQTGTVTGTTGVDFVAVSTTTYTYDAVGNETQVYTDAGTDTAGLSQTSYDNVNRPTCQVVRMNPATFAAAYGAGSRPNACALGAAGSDGPDRIERTIYDAAGQVLELRQAVGTPLERIYSATTYSPNGKAQSLTDANGNRSTMTYDGFDRLQRLNFPVAQKGAGVSSTTDYEQYGYDASGNRTSLRRRSGGVLTYAYDPLNRMSDKSGTGIDAVSYAYDRAGRPLNAVFEATGQGVVYSYDTAGRQTSEATFGQALAYDYDKANNLIRMTWPDGNYAVMTMTPTNRMASAAVGASAPFVTFGFDDLSRRASASYSSGANSTWAYDRRDRLAGLSHDLPGVGQDVMFGLTFNPAAQIRSQSTSNPAYVWRADASSQTANADGLNRDASIAGTGGYDANQNLAQSAGRTFTYDGENRLTGVGGNVTGSLSYDPLGRLNRTMIDGAVTRFLYFHDRMVAEQTPSGTILRRYLFGDQTDEPISAWEGPDFSDQRLLHANRQGSIIAASTAAGAITFEYGPYGELINSTPTASRFGYTGQIFLPPLALNHFKARAYDPARGWFLQTDPYMYKETPNLYEYSQGDPVNRKDPSGNQSVPDVIIGIIHGLNSTAQVQVTGNSALAEAGVGVYMGRGPTGDLRIGANLTTGPQVGNDVSANVGVNLYAGDTSNIRGFSKEFSGSTNVAGGTLGYTTETATQVGPNSRSVPFAGLSVGPGVAPISGHTSRQVTIARDIRVPMRPTSRVVSTVTRAGRSYVGSMIDRVLGRRR